MFAAGGGQVQNKTGRRDRSPGGRLKVFRSFGGKLEPLGETRGSDVLLHLPLMTRANPKNDPSAENNDRNMRALFMPTHPF